MLDHDQSGGAESILHQRFHTIAVIGGQGSGKTTLLNLLFDLDLKVAEGTIGRTTHGKLAIFLYGLSCQLIPLARRRDRHGIHQAGETQA